MFVVIFLLFDIDRGYNFTFVLMILAHIMVGMLNSSYS